jgi:poly-gamma-glutamate capsule biosynthesis protein CapA/YwtB (metallophosphatase superfamily)
MRKTLAILLICLIVLPFGAALAQEDVVEVVVTLAGDCTLGSEEQKRKNLLSFDTFVHARGYDYPFKKVQSIFAHDDVTIINLEGVFYNHSGNRVKKTYNFRGPTEFANILSAGSVEAVFVGNNHIIDYGSYGFKSTISALEEVGVPWFATTNSYCNTYIFEKEGFKVGFTGAYTSTYVGFRNKMELDMQTLQDAGCDAIIAVMHGGTEYSPVRVKGQERLAAWYVRNGATAVVGHHPHVVQGMDVMDGASVIYSLGNFSFGGNAQLRATQALLAQVTLRFSREEGYLGHQVNLIPVAPSGTLEYNNFQPVILRGDDARAVMDLVQRDTPFKLAPYVEGVGAVQPFMPVPEPPAEEEAAE